jgi:hypothetical protein
VVREERHFVTTRSLIVACISAEATTSKSDLVKSIEHVSRSYHLSKPAAVRVYRVTVSVLSGGVILGKSQLLGYTVGWKGISDMKVMEGRESKRALQAI